LLERAALGPRLLNLLQLECTCWILVRTPQSLAPYPGCFALAELPLEEVLVGARGTWASLAEPAAAGVHSVTPQQQQRQQLQIGNYIRRK
jgi:hypothetical protein